MPSKADADYADSVEPIVRKTAAWAWRLLVILVALVALLWVIARLEIIVVPLLLALMLSALLIPIRWTGWTGGARPAVARSPWCYWPASRFWAAS